MENLQVPLTLTVGEINAVLTALSELPYKQSAALINKIKGFGDPVVLAELERQKAPVEPEPVQEAA